MIKQVRQVSRQRMHPCRSLSGDRKKKKKKKEGAKRRRRRRKALEFSAYHVFQLCASLALCRYKPRVCAHECACDWGYTAYACWHRVSTQKERGEKKEMNTCDEELCCSNLCKNEVADAEDELSVAPRTVRYPKKKKRKPNPKANTVWAVRDMGVLTDFLQTVDSPAVKAKRRRKKNQVVKWSDAFFFVPFLSLLRFFFCYR